tara:strand:- start:239 stop:1423 length:1185 start_codon:yes stop_codon:yes gene_type:complete
MRLIVICVFFPPLKSSAAIQINDLVNEFINQGHFISVITPDNSIKESYEISQDNFLNVYRFKTNKIKDINLFKRTINEFLMPFQIIFTIIWNSINLKNHDGIIWWSPSIFFTPLILFLKLLNNCPDYLILRDIFPRWAKDLNLINNNLIYFIFEIFFNFQCFVADIIGVQSIGNIQFLPKKIFSKKTNIEVLNNWYTPMIKNFDIKIKNIDFKNKKVFIYAGNIGLAQGFEILLDIAEKLKFNKNVLFLFIGRGSHFSYFQEISRNKGLINVIFHKEITNVEIISLYKNCFAGMVVLNKNHKTHNIPGKFISYIHSGLPVFAILNKGNDLIKIINDNKVGYATSSYKLTYLEKKINYFIESTANDFEIRERSKALAKKQFNTKNICNQILKRLK